MAKTRASGAVNTSIYATALTAANYNVWDTMEDGQVELSACADADGQWKLGAPSDFVKLCGKAPPSPPTPSPVGPGRCVPNVKGPACKVDLDCTSLSKSGCVRCAHSGFCTDIPILA